MSIKSEIMSKAASIAQEHVDNAINARRTKIIEFAAMCAASNQSSTQLLMDAIGEIQDYLACNRGPNVPPGGIPHDGVEKAIRLLIASIVL